MRIVGYPSSINWPLFRQDAAEVIQSLQALEVAPDSLPFELRLSNGKTVTIDKGMVELRRIQKTSKESGSLPMYRTCLWHR